MPELRGDNRFGPDTVQHIIPQYPGPDRRVNGKECIGVLGSSRAIGFRPARGRGRSVHAGGTNGGSRAGIGGLRRETISFLSRSREKDEVLGEKPSRPVRVIVGRMMYGEHTLIVGASARGPN